MGLDTEIKGSPSSVRAAAGWITGSLGPAVDRGVDALLDAGRTAGGDWRGDTGTAFADAMGRGAKQADRVQQLGAEVARAFEDFAGTLQRCQHAMADIRREASDAGLTVAGFVIQDPGPGPADPGAPPELSSQQQVDAWNARVEAWNAHQDKVRAYNRLGRRVEEVWQDLQAGYDDVSAKDRSLDGPGWAFTLSDVSGGLAGAALDLHSSILRADATYFSDLAQQNLDRLNRMERVVDPARHYDDLAHYQNLAATADDELDAASRFARLGKAGPAAFGGLLAVGGIAYDHYAGGEGWDQAAASNLGGFGASVATGALVGTAIGGPVGTVVGTVVGAGVGVFTSGMIDGLWENDWDISDGLGAGVDALADTGEAIGDVGGAIVDGIGGLFG